MPARRLVTYVSKRSIYNDSHGRIKNIGGYYLGWPWMFSEDIAIYYIKKKIEEYFILSVANRELEIIVAIYNGEEYLKTETDGYSPDNLLALPEFSRELLVESLSKN
jgi:hypothetical protein